MLLYRVWVAHQQSSRAQCVFYQPIRYLVSSKTLSTRAIVLSGPWLVATRENKKSDLIDSEAL